LIELTTRSVEETEALGRRLGEQLFSGAFIALSGDLGAGKTALARGIGEGVGSFGIMSPTFTIVQEHEEGRLPLFHFDAYRLGGADDLYDIGFSDYLAREGAALMEWPENAAEALPGDRLDITIEGSGDGPRLIRIEARGPRHACLIGAVEGI